MFTFKRIYALIAILLFAIELVIGFFVHDQFIRPFIGDLLVVILLYAIVRAFFNISVPAAAFGVLFFAYIVEVLQYFKIAEVLGLNHSKIARIIIGTSFSWLDILMYTIGITFVLVTEFIYPIESNQKMEQ